MIMIYDYICTRVHLNPIAMCRNDMIVKMCLCLLLVAIYMMYHWLDAFHH